MTLRAAPLLLAGCIASAACAGRDAPGPQEQAPVLAGPDDRSFRAPHPDRAVAVEALVAQLGRAEGEAVLGLARAIVAHGEFAAPALLAALGDPSPRMRERAAYALGVLRDRRTLPALGDVAEGDAAPRVRYEAASALLGMGDPRGLPVLVDGLSDADPRLRAKCGEVLRDSTGLDLGFAADDPPEDRAAAVRRWRAWLAQRAEGIPAPTPASPPPSDGEPPAVPER